MGFKKYVFTLVLVMAGLGAFAQQRALTSTYPFNGLLINPAYAGSLNLLSITAVHREQWINIEGAPVYQAFTANTSLLRNKIGVGLMANRDQIGAHENYSVYGSYAYKIRTDAGILAMGIQGGFDSRTTDFTKVETYHPGDLKLTGVHNRFTPNFGTGIYFANPKFYAGISVPYIMENQTYVSNEMGSGDFEESRESRYYYATTGFVFDLTESIKLSPSFLLRIQEQNRIAYDITGMIIFDKIAYAGLSVRNSGDITFIGQLILNENFRVGYAYDAITSEITQETNGSHEILLNYRIKLRNYKKDPACPVFF